MRELRDKAGREDPNKALRKMANTVGMYIEHYENIFGKGGPGMHEREPMNRKEKGQSRPAMTPAAIRYIENPKNRRTAHVLEPLIAELSEVPRSTYLGYDLYSLVCRCGYNTTDHGYLRNLLSPTTRSQRMELEAWHFVRWKIATQALKRTGGAGLEVVVNPREGAQPDKTTAYHHDRRVSQAESHRRRYERFKALEEELGCSREAAKAEWSRREGMSVPTIERAIAFCERKEGAA